MADTNVSLAAGVFPQLGGTTAHGERRGRRQRSDPTSAVGAAKSAAVEPLFDSPVRVYPRFPESKRRVIKLTHSC